MLEKRMVLLFLRQEKVGFSKHSLAELHQCSADSKQITGI